MVEFGFWPAFACVLEFFCTNRLFRGQIKCFCSETKNRNINTPIIKHPPLIRFKTVISADKDSSTKERS